jgi:hypothetical protein
MLLVVVFKNPAACRVHHAVRVRQPVVAFIMKWRRRGFPVRVASG